MDIKELRIGNWVIQNHYAQVTEITKSRCITTNGVANWDYVLPIELTPQILSRIKGCERVYTENHPATLYSIGDMYLLFPEGYDIQFSYWTSLPASSKTMCNRYIKHLHQLQNLYYSLTGKELEIEL